MGEDRGYKAWAGTIKSTGPESRRVKEGGTQEGPRQGGDGGKGDAVSGRKSWLNPDETASWELWKRGKLSAQTALPSTCFSQSPRG